MKKLNITKEAFNKSRYFQNKYGKLEYVSESGKIYKTDKGQVIKFNESNERLEKLRRISSNRTNSTMNKKKQFKELLSPTMDDSSEFKEVLHDIIPEYLNAIGEKEIYWRFFLKDKQRVVFCYTGSDNCYICYFNGDDPELSVNLLNNHRKITYGRYEKYESVDAFIEKYYDDSNVIKLIKIINDAIPKIIKKTYDAIDKLEDVK